MGQWREVKEVVRGTAQVDGAGVKLVRVIGLSNVTDFDPFLMLDAFDSSNPADYVKGFPWHPHRGIETITYLIHGEIEHGDNLGHKGTITDGSCQWMTAGAAVLHQEMPKASPRMLGVQLWLNLPAKDKMVAAKYNDLSGDMVTKVEEEDAVVRIISGSYNGTLGAMQGEYVDATFLDVDLKAHGTWSWNTNPEETVFIYIVEGSGTFGSEKIHELGAKNAVLFEEGNELVVRTKDNDMRFFVFSGKPLREPIAWGGPVVMNTREELEQAFREIRQGTFIKK